MVKKYKLLNRLKDNKDVFRLIIIIASIVVIMSIVSPGKFWTLPAFQSMMTQMPEYGIMAIGCSLAMITGGIDLSIVGIANMSAVVSAIVLKALVPAADATAIQQTTGILIAIATALAIGAFAGFLNGFLIAKTTINPMLVTIGSLQVYTGLAIVFSEARSITGLPMVYSELVTHNVFGVIPLPTILFIVVVIFTAIMINKTAYGKKIHMLGSNPKAARLSGLRTDRILMSTYLYSGFLAAFASLIMMGNYNSAKATYGEAYTLQTILIAVLGGVSPLGGKGKIAGIVLAIITLQLLSAILNMFPTINSFFRPLIWGVVLLMVLSMNIFPKRKIKNRVQLLRRGVK